MVGDLACFSGKTVQVDPLSSQFGGDIRINRLVIQVRVFRAAGNGRVKGSGLLGWACKHIGQADAAWQGADGEQQHDADNRHWNKGGIDLAVELAENEHIKPFKVQLFIGLDKAEQETR